MKCLPATKIINLCEINYTIIPRLTFRQRLTCMALLVLATMLTLFSQRYAVIRAGAFIALTIITIALGELAHDSIMTLTDRLIVSKMGVVYV